VNQNFAKLCKVVEPADITIDRAKLFLSKMFRKITKTELFNTQLPTHRISLLDLLLNKWEDNNTETLLIVGDDYLEEIDTEPTIYLTSTSDSEAKALKR
jgi:hypothetical protein